MPRRTILLVAVVLSLSLAGCSALPMWDDDTPGDGTPTDADGVPTADPGGEGGAGPDVDYPDGYGPGGVADAETALDGHVDALGATDGYTFTYDGLVREGDSETAIGLVNYADNADGVGYEVQNLPGSAVAAYYENDTRYLQVEQGGEVQYNSTAVSYSMSRFSGHQYVGPLLANVEYGDAEVIETDRETFYHYVGEEVTDPSAILRNQVDEDRVERFDVAIVVDEDGVVRHANFVVEADRDVTVTMDVGEIGSTDADRPEWYDEAADA